MDTSVYVDTAALEGWSAKMATINEAAISDLSHFVSKANELDGSFEGNSASAFLSSTDSFINMAKSGHQKMSNVKNFLIEVVNTMESE